VAKIRVGLAGEIREIVGQKELEMEIENATVLDLVESMAKKYGERFRSAVFDESGKRLRMIVAKNNQEIEFLQGLDTPLKDGDKVMLLPPIAGG